jgi:anthranilate phosphoribosyltransferase
MIPQLTTPEPREFGEMPATMTELIGGEILHNVREITTSFQKHAEDPVQAVLIAAMCVLYIVCVALIG